MTDKKSTSKKTFSSFIKKWFVKITIALGLFILIASIIAWLIFIRNSPQNIFDSMLTNNLRTASFTRVTSQDSGAQSLLQVVRVQNRTDHITKGITTINQNGTIIVTESVGTPNVEFIKYNKIETDQKNSKGEILNFDGALNIWGENKSEDSQLTQLYQDVTVGNLFLFADLDLDSRNILLKQIDENNVYSVDYSKAKRSFEGIRPKITYDVELNPKEYISMIKEYGKLVGLNQFESINPDDYADSKPIPFKVTLDVISQRVDVTQASDGSNNQRFSGYGIIENIEIPKEYIPANELQQKLSEKAGA